MLLFPIPNWTFIEGTSDPSGYQARFREVANATGCFLHDPLPDLWRHDLEERRTFCSRHDAHLSAAGHRAMARSLAPIIEALIQRGEPERRQRDPAPPVAVSQA